MKSILKKLFDLSIWNTASAAINFFSNILIVKIFGIDVFGDLAYLGSIVGIFSLVYLIIPTNFSIIRYQEDPEFKYILTAFYLISSILLLILSLVFYQTISIPLWLFFLYGWTTCFQSYFDISLQAENKLQKYFKILFLIAILKVVLIVLYFLFVKEHSFFNLLSILVLSRLLIFLYLLFSKSNLLLKSLLYFKKTYLLIWSEKKLLSGFYLSVGLQRLSSNIIILIFQPILGNEIIGIYALLMKVYQFISGLLRSIEALFVNKLTNKLYERSFFANAFKIAFIGQLLLLAIGLIYMKYLTGEFYLIYLLVYSLLIYPYIFFIKSRAYFLLKYKNKEIIIAYILFLLIVSVNYLGFILIKESFSLNVIVISFISATVFQMLYLIFAEKKTIITEKNLQL